MSNSVHITVYEHPQGESLHLTVKLHACDKVNITAVLCFFLICPISEACCNRCWDVFLIFRYRIARDPAGWLVVGKDTGLIKVKNKMDRESPFVKGGKYTALIGAYDNGTWRLEMDLSLSKGEFMSPLFYICLCMSLPR